MGPTSQDETLLWAADLLASLDLEDIMEDQASDEDDHEGDEAPVLGAFEEDFGQAFEGTDLEDETDTFFDALFGWIFDFFAGLFGDEDEPDTEYASPPANVSEDLIFIPIEPDAELLASLEEEEAVEDLDLIF